MKAVFLFVFGILLLSCQTSSFDNGKQSFNKGAYADAIEHFSDYIRNDPSKWEAYFYRGISYKNLNELDSAENDLLLVLSLAPNPPLDAYGHVGDIYYKQGYVSNAVLYFHTITQKEEFHPLANFNLGLCYFDLQFPEKATYYLKKEIKYNPSYPFSYFVIGDVFYSKGEHDSALYYLDQGLRLDHNEDAYRLKEKILNEGQEIHRGAGQAAPSAR